MVPDLAAAIPPVPHIEPALRLAGPQIEADDAAWFPLSFAFGPFLLQPQHQLLLRADRPVRIGGRAFDILTALVSRPGQLVSKHELLDLVWPLVHVEEGNLKANMAGLRRTLGEHHATPRYIATVVGRGYRFVCPVRVTGEGYRGG